MSIKTYNTFVALILVFLAFNVVSCGNMNQNSSSSTKLGIDFTADPGKRVDNASIPFMLKISDGTYRMFFSPGTGNTSNTAVSSNCSDFTLDPANTVKGIGRDNVILKIGSYYRIFYVDQKQNSSGKVEYSRVKTATSETGLDFTQSISIAYTGGTDDKNIVGVPDEIALLDGNIRMFYVGDFYGKNNVRTAISYDNGYTFTYEAGNVCGDDDAAVGCKYVDPDVIKMPDGTYKMYVMSAPDGVQNIYSFSSSDCKTFTLDSGIRIKPSDFNDPTVTALYDPDAILLPDGSIRLFCWADAVGSENPCIISATSK